MIHGSHLYQLEDVELIHNLDSSAGKCNARIESNCPMIFRGSMVDHKWTLPETTVSSTSPELTAHLGNYEVLMILQVNKHTLKTCNPSDILSLG